MTGKLDLRMIVKDHLSTFSDDGTYSVELFFITVAAPLAFALAALRHGPSIVNDNIDTLISVFAIFSGLLFNVLMLIYSLPIGNGDGQKLLRESIANISYAILVALAAVIVLTALLFVSGYARQFLEACVVFFSANFLLSLLMVLKRIHLLLREKFPKQD
ncbi:hypothetical protein [Mesorhizobium sp. BR1-1-14]|uniref:hypothetical protein n=1 Tax=Mesorhizobium sp. BR1-1-14 TaxID=2876655 RepID=UPI001CD0E976|nr:hypothetical protein [Mesorhizobium sp. BR1-1-14]MBZ9959314.1 hypothetical protein [Mesorhizobium sp. BR1-1-14]